MRLADWMMARELRDEDVAELAVQADPDRQGISERTVRSIRLGYSAPSFRVAKLLEQVTNGVVRMQDMDPLDDGD